MQDKLHCWAQADPARAFDDLFNLVYDPSFMLAAWDRVRGNKGGRTPGVDGIAPRSLLGDQAMVMLADLRQQVKTRQYVPQPVREHKIPKPGGKTRSLGIPTMGDRTDCSGVSEVGAGTDF